MFEGPNIKIYWYVKGDIDLPFVSVNITFHIPINRDIGLFKHKLLLNNFSVSRFWLILSNKNYAEVDFASALGVITTECKCRSSKTRSWCMHEEYVKDLYYVRFHTHCYREVHFSFRVNINFDKVNGA